MMTKISASNPFGDLGSLLARIIKPLASHRVSGDTETYRRAERDLISEAIRNNPEAFSSGLDVEHFMNMRGRR
jgi:hypothetical protein